MSRTKTILFLTEDYAERLDVLYREADRLEREAKPDSDGPRRMGSDAALVRVREQYEALKAEAEENGQRVTVRSLSRGEWKKLKVDHPPRTVADGATEEQADGDEQAGGVNADEVEDDLICAALVHPEFSDRDAFDAWLDDLPMGDSQQVLAAAFFLAVGSKMDPKSLRPSATTSSDETSN